MSTLNDPIRLRRRPTGRHLSSRGAAVRAAAVLCAVLVSPCGCTERFDETGAREPGVHDAPHEAASELLAKRLRALPSPPGSSTADPIASRAIAMLGRGAYSETEVLLRALLHDRPTDVQLQLLLAVAIHKQQRYAEALQWYDAVIDAAAPFPIVDQLPHFLGWCLYYLGRTAEARVAFEDHVRRVGDEPDSLFGLGVIAFEDDRVEDAQSLLLRSLAALPATPAAAPDAAKAHVRLGDVYVRLGRLAEAEIHLRKGVELHADHSEAWAKLARLLHRLGRPEEANEAQRMHDESQRRAGRG